MDDATELTDEELAEQIKMLEKLQADLQRAIESGDAEGLQLVMSNIKDHEHFQGALELVGALQDLSAALGVPDGVQLLHVGLRCDHDGCDAIMKHDPGNTPGDMRAEGNHEGWLVQYEGGGLDYCPNHRRLYEGDKDGSAGVSGPSEAS